MSNDRDHDDEDIHIWISNQASPAAKRATPLWYQACAGTPPVGNVTEHRRFFLERFK